MRTESTVNIKLQEQTERAGYKKTKLGWIPEQWEIVKLGEVGEFKNGINKKKEDFGFGVPFINLMDVFGKPVLLKDDWDLVNANQAEIENYSLQKGDILFIRSSVKPSGVGLTSILKEDVPNTVYSGFLIRYRLNKESTFNIDYLRYCFHERGFRQRLIIRSSSSANTNINQDNLKQLFIGLPSLPEQQKIAKILSTWDTAIATQEQLIAAKETFKKGLMQVLLTGQKRFEGFEGEWDKPTVEETFNFLSTTSYSRNQMNYDGENGILNIHYGDIHSTYNNVILDVLTNEYIPKLNKDVKLPSKPDFLEDGDLIIADASEDYEGVGEAIEITNINGKRVISGLHTLALRDKNQTSIRGFRAYIFKNPIVKKALKTIATGSKVYGISKGNFQKMKIVLPSRIEQEKIALILSYADKEIELLKQQLVQLQDQKRGLMQRLLTGEVRVKIN